MKTLQRLIREYEFSAGGWKSFRKLCDELVREMSKDFVNSDCVREEMDALIAKINGETLPASDCVLVESYVVDADGDDHECNFFYDREHVSNLKLIQPWEDITLDFQAVQHGDLVFWKLEDDILITTRLAAYHQLPRNFRMDTLSLDQILGTLVSGRGHGISFIKRTLEDILYIKLYDGIVDSYPLSFIADEKIPFPKRPFQEIDFTDEDSRDQYSKELRRNMLQSFLALYDNLKRAKCELLEELI